MKKSIFVFFILLCLFLVGCGEQPIDKKDEKNDEQEEKKEEKPVEKDKYEQTINMVVGEEKDFGFANDAYLTIAEDDCYEVTGSILKALKMGNTTFTVETTTEITKYTISIIAETLTIKKDDYCVLASKTDLIDYQTNSKAGVTFTSSDETIATVNKDGVITGVGNGIATIKVKTYSLEEEVTVEVLDTNNVCVAVEDTIEYEFGSTKYLLIDPTNKKNDGYRFSYDTNALTISTHGLVTPKKIGKTTVSIFNSKGEKTEMVINVFEKFDNIDFRNEQRVNIFGRTKVNSNGDLVVYHSASGFECVFEGTSIKATIYSNCSLSPYGYIKVYVDGNEYSIGLDKGQKAVYTLAENLNEGTHTIKVVKRTEESTGRMEFSNIIADKFVTPPAKKELKMEVYGDSYTAGYGVLGKSSDPHNATIEDCTNSYAYVASQLLNAQLNMYCYSGISIGIPGWIKNFLLPDIAPYYASQDQELWDFDKYQADIIVIYLGTNDNYGLGQGYGTTTDFSNKYKAFIRFLLEKTPDAKIVCCYGFSSMNSTMETTIKNMPKSFPNKVFTCKLPSASLTGANGHPNASSQVKGGETLANFITANVLPVIEEEKNAEE